MLIRSNFFSKNRFNLIILIFIMLNSPLIILTYPVVIANLSIIHNLKIIDFLYKQSTLNFYF